MTLEDIARICHEANRAYCETLGDMSQPPWSSAPDWQKNSAIAGVAAIYYGDVKTPEESHLSWWRQKQDDGWRFGPVKDEGNKTHPCMVPYNQLPEEQCRKDSIFFAIVRACLE
jgi:hypothetical protein